MKPNNLLGFVVSVAAMCVILVKLSFNEERVALHKLENQLQREFQLKEQIEKNCHRVLPHHRTIAEKAVAAHLNPVESVATQNCDLYLESTSTQRFRLRSYWSFALTLQPEGSGTLIQRVYRVEFPRPLTLLPFAIFLLALVFEFPFWGLGWTLGSYLFLLSGANLKAMIQMVSDHSVLAANDDPTLWGLLLIVAWISLYRSHLHRRPPAGKKVSPPAVWFNRGLSAIIGLWNPAVFTLSARLLQPFRGSVLRIASFLDAQFFVLCLSLYLLSFDVHELGSFVENSVLLPRYFTFTALLFIFLSAAARREKRIHLLWDMPRFGIAAAFVIAVEVASNALGFLASLPTLTRIGLALVSSELIFFLTIRWGLALRTFCVWGGAVFLSSILAVTSVQSGMQDLATTLFDPRIHPTGVVLFTFLSGICLGVLTGSFAVSYFTLVGILMSSMTQPLVRAALLDGILAGILISPFSLFNLVPAIQYRLNFQALIRNRFRQLSFPLLIGTIIYTVSAVNSVAILRPATFIFLCLVGIAWRLQEGRWLLGGFFRPLAAQPPALPK